MLDGIKEACDAWGRTMRWAMSDTGEGYPTLSTFERARGGELDAKAAGQLRQKFGEVFLGDAKAVMVAIRREPIMPEELHRAIFMKHVVPHRAPDRRVISDRQKAEELGYSNKRQYYQVLSNAYHWLLGRVDIATESSTWSKLGTNGAHSMGTVETCAHT